MIRLAFLFTLATQAWACVCATSGETAKQAWQRSTIVFLGTVERATPDANSIFEAQELRVRVEEAFKGVSKDQTLALHQGTSDCDPKLRTGLHAVFYLSALSVGGCRRALGDATIDGDDLLFLHGLPKSAEGTRISGWVAAYDGLTGNPPKSVGIGGVKVRIRGPAQAIREVVTNASGTFEIYGLPPGEYSASIDAPAGLKIYSSSITGIGRGRPSTSGTLAKDGSLGFTFSLRPDTRVSGHVLDVSGTPVPNIRIELEPASGKALPDVVHLYAYSKADGSFQIEMMPSGDYRVVSRAVYYPGVVAREKATAISVRVGVYAEHVDIRFPK